MPFVTVSKTILIPQVPSVTIPTRLHLQGKVARRAIVCVVQIFRTHIVQIFRTHIVQIYLEHSFAISRLVYASKIV